MANNETFRTLFENDYTNFDAILQNLVKPVFGEKVRSHNKSVAVEKQDESLIKNITVFASLGGAFPINFIDVTIKSKTRIHQNRVTVQNCVRRIMENLDSALIFFHYEDFENRPWRISFVNKGETAKEVTNPKRYTYLCGVGCSCRTAVERFEILKNEIQSGQKNLKDLMVNAFSVESVSNEFFEEYREHYADFVEYLSGNRYVKKGGAFVQEKTGKASKYYKEAFVSDDKAVRDYVKKLMGRLVFLQFLQKKGWMGVVEENKWSGGDKNFTNNLFKAASTEQKKNFLQDVLKPIFFNCLNKDRKEKGDKFDTGVSSIGKNGVVRIPYLNGGLFKSETEDETVVKFPEELFENLFDFFSRYNFTIDESDPLDVEVGVDPEMLGKIFENLLEDNKDKGAFYTPKEIVNYMCKESLTAYLINNEELKIDNGRENKRMRFTEKGYEKRIANFVQNPCKETASVLTQEELLIVNYKLLIVKICDPAVGSGAFPMGLLNLLFNCRVALGDKTPHSDLKKQIVQNNIYGVDIEKGAVDIARLRFWLAIVVDAEKPEPLPNLDYKIMQGNSLIESYKGIDLSVLTKRRKENDGKTSDIGKKTKRNEEYQNDLLVYEDDGSTVDDNIPKLIGLLDCYFHPDDSKAKQDIDAQIMRLAHKILGAHFNKKEELDELEKKGINNNPEFFLWHLWFSDVFNRPAKQIDNGKLKIENLEMSRGFDFANAKSGFDIVIGNPPYFVYQGTHKGEIEQLKKISELKSAFGGKLNAYKLFLAKALNSLCKQNGVVSYIFQNSFMADKQATELRKEVFSKNQIIEIDSFPERDSVKKRVFESVKMSVCVVLIKKTKTDLPFVVHIWDDKNKTSGITTTFTKQDIIAIDAESMSIPRLKQEYLSLVVKIKSLKNKKYLHCFQGELNMTVHRLYFNMNKSNPKVLKGASIQRYYWTEEMSQGEIEYVDEKKYLKDFPKSEKAQHHNFERIGMQGMTGANDKIRIVATIIEKGFYMAHSCNYIVSEYGLNLRYVLGVLNSELINWYFRCFSTNSNVNSYEIESIPIPQATEEKQAEIISLVDKILVVKKSNQSADTSEWEHKINEIVYGLYGLSKQEIDIVEGKGK